MKVLCPLLLLILHYDCTRSTSIGFRKKCSTDVDCNDNSYCSCVDNFKQGYCKCKDGFYLVESVGDYKCLPGSKFHKQCVSDIQCQVNLGAKSFCSPERNRCECTVNAHLAADERCYETSIITENCTVNFNCVVGEGSTVRCHDGQCRCFPGFHPSKDRMRCVRTQELGCGCSSDEECGGIANAGCYSSSCQCNPCYTASMLNDKCLKIAKPGEKCSENRQCAEYMNSTVCCNSTCVCREGYHLHESNCIVSVPPGGNCTNKIQCVITPEMKDVVDCVNGICVLQTGSVISDPVSSIVYLGIIIVLVIVIITTLALIIYFKCKDDCSEKSLDSPQT